MPLENDFKKWYKQRADKHGLSQNPDDPEHYYDYRAAYMAGAEPDETGHWPSAYKTKGHPRMVIDGVNTKTGESVMPERQEVEKYKITPEMKGFLKTYKSYKQVSDRLRGKMQIELDQASQTRQMLDQIEKGMQLLTFNAPSKPTFDVQGQEDLVQKRQLQEDVMPQQEMQQQGFDPSLNY